MSWSVKYHFLSQKQRRNAVKENDMFHKPTRSKYTTLQQICKLIPSGLVDKIAQTVGVDKKARTFRPWSHVVALLYTQLVHAMSLNDVCDSLRHHAARLFTNRGATAPKRNTFSHANRTRDPRMAETLFWNVLDHLVRLFPGFGGRTYQVLPRRFKRVINVVDASTIALVANCMDWAKHRRKKAAAKLHLRLDLQSFLPSCVIIDTAREHDATRARDLCANLGAGEIVIFDKAYLDFAHLAELTERGVSWVTRAKSNMKARCVKRLIKKPHGRILRDDLIVLTGTKSAGYYPGVLRRVVALVDLNGTDTVMTFISNNTEWAASSIADLYKSRWSIEVFFKEIKQTLQLCDFLGHNKNAILWQIWTAPLLYVLLRFLAFMHRWQYGFKRFFCILRSCVWDCYDLGNLIKSCGTAGDPVRLLAMPQQAYLPGFGPP